MNSAASKKVENQSMEEILSSIRRIIADDQKGASAIAEEKAMPPASSEETGLEADILALRSALNAIRGEMDDIRSEAAVSFPDVASVPEKSEEEPEAALLSPQAGGSVRQSLDELSRVSEAAHRQFDIEAAAKDMLRPMLSEWLNEHLPSLVERLVKQEIARITGDRK